MSTGELAAKLKLLSPEQRQMVESLIQVQADRAAPTEQRDLTGHSSFGAWSGRKDLPPDSDAMARELRKRVARRDSA